jgi:hypothetical protein
MKARLSGRDPMWPAEGAPVLQPAQPIAPTDATVSAERQLDLLLQHATAPANLAVMYEGWTSWL